MQYGFPKEHTFWSRDKELLICHAQHCLACRTGKFLGVPFKVVVCVLGRHLGFSYPGEHQRGREGVGGEGFNSKTQINPLDQICSSLLSACSWPGNHFRKSSSLAPKYACLCRLLQFRHRLVRRQGHGKEHAIHGTALSKQGTFQNLRENYVLFEAEAAPACFQLICSPKFIGTEFFCLLWFWVDWKLFRRDLDPVLFLRKKKRHSHARGLVHTTREHRLAGPTGQWWLLVS